MLGGFIARRIDDPARGGGRSPLSRRRSNPGPPPAHDGAAPWIEVAARPDGTLSVTNSRNGFSKDLRHVAVTVDGAATSWDGGSVRY